MLTAGLVLWIVALVVLAISSVDEVQFLLAFVLLLLLALPFGLGIYWDVEQRMAFLPTPEGNIDLADLPKAVFYTGIATVCVSFLFLIYRAVRDWRLYLLLHGRKRGEGDSADKRSNLPVLLIKVIVGAVGFVASLITIYLFMRKS